MTSVLALPDYHQWHGLKVDLPHPLRSSLWITPDLQEAARFLHLLDGNTTKFTFQTFDDDKVRKDRTLARIFHGTLEQHAAALMELNRRGAGVFVMVQHGDGKGRRNVNVQRIRAVFQEDDGNGKPLPLEPHIVVASSPGKHHRYIRVDGSNVDADDFSVIQKQLVANYGSDPNAKDRARVLRLPGFFHLKNPAAPHMVHIIHESGTPPYTRDQILAEFPPTNIPTKRKRPATLTGGTITEGSRNAHLASHAGGLRRRGMGLREIEAALLVENTARCEPPLPVSEVLGVAASASKYEAVAHSDSFHLTDYGNAQRFVAQHGSNIRYIPAFRKWVTWREVRWVFDEDGEVDRRSKATVMTLHIEAACETNDQQWHALSKHAYQSESERHIKALIELAKTELGIPITPSELDRDPFLLSVNNGTLDLRTCTLRVPRREDYITKHAHVDYVLGADCPIWRAFLHRVMSGNPSLIAFIQRVVGYFLTGSTREQCLLLLLGTGANGKSVFVRIVMALLGDYATQVSSETLMIKRGNNVPNDIARLRGARFIAASETEDGQRLAESLLKQLTGEDRIAARYLYGEWFEFQMQAKICVTANHKPIIRGDDYAIWRRIHLIPFNVTIPEAERDKELGDKLLGELPGILNWAVEGLMAWHKNGLQPPDEVRAATDAYRSEMDVIRAWIEERCVVAPHAKAGATALYNDYRQWAEEQTGWVMKQRKFGQKMTEHGFRRERTPHIVYFGIGLLLGEF